MNPQPQEVTIDSPSKPSDVRVAREEWVGALIAWANDDAGPDPGVGLVAALTALDEQDEDTLRACIVAAGERHGPAWTVEEFRSVVQSLTCTYGDGWAGLAEDCLDDHYPGLPRDWLNDLHTIGRAVKRDSEQYVLLDSNLYVFNR